MLPITRGKPMLPLKGVSGREIFSAKSTPVFERSKSRGMRRPGEGPPVSRRAKSEYLD